jgi:4-oxalocrotonate tautomerase
MPVITLDIGKVSKEKKAELVKELVLKASQTLNIPEQAFVTIIRENDFDNIGNGTRLLSDIIDKK